MDGNGTQQPALPAAPPGKELALYQQPTIAAYEPRNITEAMTLAKLYADSGLAPQFTKQAQVMLVMATGAELGIPATAALRAIYVGPGNKIGLESKLKLALCLRAKAVCKYFRMVSSSDTEATYETLRVGDEKSERITFTIDDAKKAGWYKPDGPYVKTPRRQLRWRAIGELADLMYPELMLGLPSVEEMYDEGEIPVRPLTVLDAEEVPPEEPAPPGPTADELLAGWEADLKAAVTIKDCEAVASEMQAHLASDSAEIKKGAAMVKARKDEIRGKKSDPSEVIK